MGMKAPFSFPCDADPAALSSALLRLASLGFHEAAVRERLGLEDLNDLQLKAVPIYRRERLGVRDALAVAIDLFVLQGTLPAAELDLLFGREEQGALARAGVLIPGEGAARAAVSLYPVGRSLVFSYPAWPELDGAAQSSVPHDQVMYIGTDSRWLARATVRRPVTAALDLCCGSGIHALLAAGHARTATAVDINPRAVQCTAFNARALGLGIVEALQGDLYAPVQGRTFSLITANPPFVPAPAQAVGFRDGGPDGEEVQRRIVAGLKDHLAPDGVAQIVTELGEGGVEPIEARLRTWLQGAPMDILVQRLRVHPAPVYAMGHAEGDDYPAFLASVDRWYANLSAQGYRQVVSVLLAFQWSQGEPWTRVDEVRAPGRDAGHELEAAFAAERLARDPAFAARLRAGRIVRTGPVALLEARALGSSVPPTAQARLAGLAMPAEYALEPLERDLLVCLDQPVPVADLLAAGAQGAIPAPAVLQALTALVRMGLAKVDP